MSSGGENFTNDDEVIIIEPIFKTEPFIRIIIRSVKSIFKMRGFKYRSIQRQDYFIIITMKNNLKLIDSINAIKFLTGISYILIGTIVKTDFDTLAKKSALIQLKLMLDNEKYFLKVSSLNSLSNKNRNLMFDLFDLEFHLQSELSSSSRGLVRVEVESDADRVLYIIMGPKLTYVSLLVFKGGQDIPINYLEDSVICPIFDSISIINFISILRSGYKPVPIFYYLNRNHLKDLIKAYEFYARRNTEGIYDFFLFSMGDLLSDDFRDLFLPSQNSSSGQSEDDPLFWIMYQTLVYNILSKIDLSHDKVALPIVTFTHPLWYMRKVYSQFKNSNKTLMTPLFFNYTLDDFKTSLLELKNLNLGMETGEREITHMTAHENVQKTDLHIPRMNQTLQELRIRHKRFNLRIGKDDIFDIFDSI